MSGPGTFHTVRFCVCASETQFIAGAASVVKRKFNDFIAFGGVCMCVRAWDEGEGMVLRLLTWSTDP